MQISVIAYTNTEENKKQIILQGAGEEKKIEKFYFWQFQLLILYLQLQNLKKKRNKKKSLKQYMEKTEKPSS